MKMEGALAKRFLRHDGIYRSDVSFPLVNLGRGSASRSGPGQAIGRAGRNTPCPSSAMSSGRLFLDRVARLQSPSPLRRQCQHKAIAAAGGRTYHQTVNSVLTVCLSKWGNPISTLCDELGLQPTVFYRWQKEFFENGAAAFQAKGRSDHQAEQERIEYLEKKIQRKDEVLAELMEEHVALKKELGEL
jgi:transposase